jgi:diguanylate cyclase (GGDEF)-like protein
LCSIVSKTQQFVQTELIERHWANLVFDYSKKQAEERTFHLTCFACVVSVVLAVALFLLLKTIRLDKIASTDGLTNIYNRRSFMNLGSIQMERINRTGSTNFIVLFDIDHFKRVNDTYGHLAGDKVLVAIAQRIKEIVRPYDLFGRYGGEEFIILMTRMDEASIVSAVERVRQEICKTPIEFEGKTIPISASFGIAPTAPQNDLLTAIQCADAALYQAKEGGRNRAVLYEDGESPKSSLPLGEGTVGRLPAGAGIWRSLRPHTGRSGCVRLLWLDRGRCPHTGSPSAYRCAERPLQCRNSK